MYVMHFILEIGWSIVHNDLAFGTSRLASSVPHYAGSRGVLSQALWPESEADMQGAPAVFPGKVTWLTGSASSTWLA